MIHPCEKYLEVFIRTFPTSLERDFRAFIGKLDSKVSAGASPAGEPRHQYWEHLPGWLFNAFKKNGKSLRESVGFLNDILWAQYCIFFVFRIHDDIYDGQTNYTSLIYASDLFLIEAERAFTRHFPASSGFWNIYRSALETTTRAIVEVSEMHQKVRTGTEALLPGYAREAAIFTLAPAAICMKFHRMKDVAHAAAFIGEMTIAGQIMDDLDDIGEDLLEGKFNYACRLLLKKSQLTDENVQEQIGQNLIRTDRIGKVFDSVQAHLALAESAIGHFDIPAAIEMIHENRKGVELLRESFHRRRVEFLFSGISGSQPA